MPPPLVTLVVKPAISLSTSSSTASGRMMNITSYKRDIRYLFSARLVLIASHSSLSSQFTVHQFTQVRVIRVRSLSLPRIPAPWFPDPWSLFPVFPVELVHRRRRSFLDNPPDRRCRPVQHFIQHRQVRLAHGRKQIILAAAPACACCHCFRGQVRTHPDAQPQPFLACPGRRSRCGLRCAPPANRAPGS